MIAVILAVLAAAVATAALRWLPGARWAYRNPRLGIAAWYAVLLTVALASGSAVAEALVPWPGTSVAACTAVIWCDEATGDGHGPWVWLTARLLAGATMVAVVLAGVRIIGGTRTIVRSRRRHRDMLRVAGRPNAELDATVIDHPQPAAYVISGRRCGVVVTSGALHHLGEGELAAVLGHERAHASGHHQIVLDILKVLPGAGVVAAARRQVERLVEMLADEVAAERYPRIDLARALVAMTARHAPGTTPGGLVAATGGDTAERLHRLMRPPQQLPRQVGAAIWIAVAALPVAPMALAAACRWWPFLASCLWGL